MPDLSFLPAVNAGLNGAATVLLIVGRVLIARKNIAGHKLAMISAFAMSTLFLVTYLVHYAWRAAVKGGTHTRPDLEGLGLTIYYLFLVSHILLATTVPIFAIALIYLGMKRKDALHRKVARFGWPIWMYVSITGVLIYFILYQWFPEAG